MSTASGAYAVVMVCSKPGGGFAGVPNEAASSRRCRTPLVGRAPLVKEKYTRNSCRGAPPAGVSYSTKPADDTLFSGAALTDTRVTYVALVLA